MNPPLSTLYLIISHINTLHYTYPPKFTLFHFSPLQTINKIPLRVGGVNVFPLDAVRDLGVILDLKLTMKNHVDSVVRSCF